MDADAPIIGHWHDTFLVLNMTRRQLRNAEVELLSAL
jgi:hypothetical protein